MESETSGLPYGGAGCLLILEAVDRHFGEEEGGATAGAVAAIIREMIPTSMIDGRRVAPAMRRLQERGYVEREQDAWFLTEAGRSVASTLDSGEWF